MPGWLSHGEARTGGVALLLTTIGSFVGGSVGIIMIILFSPVIANAAFSFGLTEYFALMCLGLIAAAGISSGSLAKGLAMVVLGIILGLVGMDIYTGEHRFTFGVDRLYDGINLIIVAMGLFGLAEVIFSIKTAGGGTLRRARSRSARWCRPEEMFRGHGGRSSVGPALAHPWASCLVWDR